MAGTILENLSGRKLIVLVAGILVSQIICFLIGGCIAPAPSNVDHVLATKCLTQEFLAGEVDHEWHIVRGNSHNPINCKTVNLNHPSVMANSNISANNIVFAVQYPGPKMGLNLDYSRWMQNLFAVLQMDIIYKEHNQMAESPLLTLEIKLGYRNKWEPEDKWNLIAASTEERRLECSIHEEKKHDGYQHDCQPLPLFELGSLHHDYYLLNMRLPIMSNDGREINSNIGHVEDIWVVGINQNGGFTKVWVSLKTFFFPIIIATMIWCWRRINLLSRPPVLIEKLLLALGIALSILNLPLEFLTLWVEIPFMLLLSDIRQGLFYAALLSFWLVFSGEHLMDDVERNRLRSYWRHLAAVAFGCLCLFIFDMCERGVQLKNPFYSIWVTDVGTNLALSFIILAGISACAYFIFLCYMVYRVFRNISFKRGTLPSMSSTRRMYYEGIIYRFKFLMMTTLLCAAMTVISYIVGQASEDRWKWDDQLQVQYTSAFFTGVYGMWNLYVFALLVLYAPSHKFYPPPADPNSSTQEEVEFSRLTTSEPSHSEPTEVSALTGFAKKTALD